VQQEQIGAQKRTKVLPQVSSEYEKLLPKLQPKEYEALKGSIRTEGQHFPLIVNAEGVVLDGHHRLRVCRELGLEPKTEVKTFPNVLLEKKFVIESNLRRRHLNDFQKAELALPLLEVERELAKQRQTAGRSQHKFLPNEGKVSQDLLNKHDRESTTIVAKSAGLSSSTFQRAVKVIERGSEQLKEKTRSGKMSISFAHKQVMRREKHRVPPATKGQAGHAHLDREMPRNTIMQEDDKVVPVHFPKHKYARLETLAHSGKSPCSVEELILLVMDQWMVRAKAWR
jgi:hypothetical protein